MTYKVQIDDVVRDATPEEVAAIEARKAAATAEQQAASAARASAIAKLKGLGLTDAEVAALTGG